MKFWKIFRFEFKLHASSVSTWLYAATLLIFTFLMNGITTPGDGIFANNTFYITSIVVIGGFLWLVMAGTITGEAAARDVQTRMNPLTFSTPVTRFDYLGARFLAAFAVNALLVLVLPVGMLISFYLPGMDQDALLPLKPAAYLNPYFLIGLPNVFVATAWQFTCSALSRQVMASYLAGLGLAIFPQLVAVTAATLLENWDLLKLLDPVGVIGIVKSELGTWTPSEKNTKLVALSGMFLWNRILWLGVGSAALLYTYHEFRFDHHEKTRGWSWLKRRRENGIKPTPLEVRPAPITIPPFHRAFTFQTWLSQTVTIGWASVRMIVRNPVGLTVVAIIATVSVAFASRIITQLGIPLLATSQQVTDYLTSPIGSINGPWVVMPLLIMYFGGVLIWNERDAGFRDIADATPVTEWALLLGKFLGLALVIMAWMALLMIAGVVMQVSLGYGKLELRLYLQTLFGLQLVDYLLFAFLTLGVHAIVNHKYVGYLVMLLVFIFIAFPSTFSVEHPLLIFGAAPEWSYTDMRDFGSTIRPWLWFKLYWIGWSLLLAVVARMLWVRGREQRWSYRIQFGLRGLTRSSKWVAIIAMFSVVSLGGYIFYNTNLLNQYLTKGRIRIALW